MSPYSKADFVQVKLFHSNSPNSLEEQINTWLSTNATHRVIDIMYCTHTGSKDTNYSCLITHNEIEIDPDMT